MASWKGARAVVVGGMDVSRRDFVATATAAAAGLRAVDASAARRSASKRLGLPDPSTITVTDPADLSLVECASLLQHRKLSSVELTQACLDRSRARDGATTAWIRVYPEFALELARAADARLSPRSERARRRKSPLVCGVPLALKDLYAAKGLPVTASSKVLAGNVATGDSTVWARLKHSGMVLLGHAHTDEFAFGSATAQTGNPWNPKMSPGGSSGGSAAVLAARFVPAATGTDTGGSLRWPAATCGVSSVKPTYGRCSAYGVIPLVWSRDHTGPMARSAADCGLLLSYMAGPDQEDTASLAGPALPSGGYPHTARKGDLPFAGQTFGVVSGAAGTLPAATAKLFNRFLEELRGLGATLKDVKIPNSATSSVPGLNVAELAETGIYHQQFLPGSTGLYSETTQAVVDAAIAAQSLPVSGYLTFMRDRTRFMHEYNALFEREGLTCIVDPVSTIDGAERSDIAGLTVLSGGPVGDTGWGDFLGVPIVTTPVGRSQATGMPFGVQIAGRPWQEAQMLQIAIDYQAAHPYWAEAPEPLMTARDIPTAMVVKDPKGKPDPTNTDAKHPATQVLPSLAASPA